MTVPVLSPALGFKVLCEERAIQGQALLAPDGGVFVTLRFHDAQTLPTRGTPIVVPAGGILITDFGELLARTGGKL